jgi:hypothetical protein
MMHQRSLRRLSLNDVVILENALLLSPMPGCFDFPELRLPVTLHLRPPCPAAFERLSAALYGQLHQRAHGVWDMLLASHQRYWCAGYLHAIIPFVDTAGAGISITITG